MDVNRGGSARTEHKAAAQNVTDWKADEDASQSHHYRACPVRVELTRPSTYLTVLSLYGLTTLSPVSVKHVVNTLRHSP